MGLMQRRISLPPLLLPVVGVLAVLAVVNVRTKPSASLEEFMESSHESFEPEMTPHEAFEIYEEQAEEAIKETVEKAKELPSAAAENIVQMEDSLAKFEEQNHEGLVPEETAADIGNKVEHEVQEMEEKMEEGENPIQAYQESVADGVRRRQMRGMKDARE